MKNSIRIILPVIFSVFFTFIIFHIFIRPITIKISCKRRAQVMNDVIRTAIVDAAYKSEPIEDKNFAKLLNEMYEKCIHNYH